MGDKTRSKSDKQDDKVSRVNGETTRRKSEGRRTRRQGEESE
jgi:hypothetical protein